MESKWDALDPNAAARRRGVMRSANGILYSLNWQWVVALLLVSAWLLRWFQLYLQQWRAAALKRNTRRRYGIPDDDHRPFHIAAQAAAVIRRQQQIALREAEKKAAAQRALEQPARTSAFDRHPAQQPQLSYSTSSLGARVPYNYNSSREINGMPRFTSQYQPRTDNWTSRYDPRPSIINSSSSRPGTGLLNVPSNARPRAVSRKHVIGGPGPLIDEPVTHRRVMKRQVDSDSEVIDSDRDRTKRARQYINLDGDDDAEMADATDTATEDDMDTDTVAAPANRSTLKRGRSDAGSVVGDSVRERKMRRKGPSSTGHTRGKKRAVETSGSEDEASGPANKRGRLSSGDEGDSDEGMHEDSDEEAQATQDSTHAGTATETSTVEPVCGDREIGDAWTEGDVKFKVGEDGRRLRLAHVKSVHTRAVKAKDIAGSPVKSTGLTPIQQTVVVERWLNDDEFAQVKSRKELAWGYDTDEEGSVDADEGQFTSARTKKAHQLTVTISDDSTSQMGGKVLLWDSGSRFSSRPSTPGGSTQPSPNTIAPSSKLQNPFHTVSVPTLGRRVASSAGGIQVPPLRYSRSFSKWEKMEAEADALERLRRGDRDEQKKKEAAAAPPTPAPAPVAASPSPFNLKPSDATPAALSSQPSPAPQATAAPASANPLFAPTSAATETATASKPAMPVFSLGTPVTTPPSSATAPAPPKPVFSFGPAPVTTPAPITVAPAAPVSAPSFPSFNIPTNPLNIAPGDKSATAAPSASGFSFGPTAAATTDKKDQPAASGLAAFVKPAGSTGGLASISFGPSAPGTTPAPATVTAPAPAPTGFSFGPAAASGAAASRPAFPGLGAAGSSSGAATPSATAAPASNLFSFGPAAPAAPTAAKPAAPGFSFGPASGTPAAAPATAPAPTTAGASSGFSFTGTGAAQKPSGFSFGPAATTVPTPMSTNAPAGAAAAPGFSFGPTTTAPAPTQAPAPGQTPNLFTPAPGANLAGGNPFAPTGGNPFASSANPGTMNAQGRPMRGRSSLSGKPPGTASSPAPGATASANLFSFASTPGAAAPVASASSPFGFSSAAPASAAGAAAQPSLFSFGPAAGVTQQPAQNPPFGGSAFSFGQK